MSFWLSKVMFVTDSRDPWDENHHEEPPFGRNILV